MKSSCQSGASALLASLALTLCAAPAEAQPGGGVKKEGKQKNGASASTRAGPTRNTDPRVTTLQQRVEQYGQQVENLRRQVSDQEAKYRELQRSIGPAKRTPAQAEDAGATLANAPVRSAPADRAAPAVPDDKSRPVQVGVAPKSEVPQASVAAVMEQPGILTGKGHYVLEPSLQYGYSSSNRVALVGYTVIPALLIGLVDVREVKRNTLTGALTGRFGLSNRLEVEAKVPWVYRSDATVSREIFTGSASDNVFDSKGKGIGDVELAARYQFNAPRDSNSPYYIGSLRYKSRTGKDPFEVVTDCTTRCVGNTTGTGLPLDLPTGSGFQSMQAGVTGLFPTDPAVFFGSLSYTQNFGRGNLSRKVLNDQEEFIGSVKPGNVVSANFGMGLAINDRSSFSIGADLHSIGRTKQNGTPVQGSVRTQLSSLLLGYSYRFSDRTTMNVSVGAGLTRDTPDVTLTVRLPMTF